MTLLGHDVNVRVRLLLGVLVQTLGLLALLLPWVTTLGIATALLPVKLMVDCINRL